MNYLRIGICEDMPEEQEILLGLLEESSYHCEPECFSDGESFLKNYYSGRYDLILMDIYMTGITGVETVSRIRKTDGLVPIAFLTTSTEHALEGYRFHVDRYLTKPYSAEELEEVLKLAADRILTQPSVQVPVSGQRVNVTQSRICYAEQEGHGCRIHLAGGEILKTGMKLAELSEILPCPPFFQCHKSYLVNLAHVRGVNRELLTFEMDDGNNAYIRRASLRSAEQTYHKYMFSVTREQAVNNEK